MLGRYNYWPHDYWRSIGWGEFWASLEEMSEDVDRINADRPSSRPAAAAAELDALAAHEARIAAQTGRRSAFSLN